MCCTPDCVAAKAKHQQVAAEWRAKWPHACTACRGWGGAVTDYDPSPAGVGLGFGVMHDFEPCAICLLENVCPRCGEQAAFLSGGDEQDTCRLCGWTSIRPDGEPEVPECFCEQERLNKEAAEYWRQHPERV